MFPRVQGILNQANWINNEGDMAIFNRDYNVNVYSTEGHWGTNGVNGIWETHTLHSLHGFIPLDVICPGCAAFGCKRASHPV